MPVVMMSGHGTIDTAVEATRIGAYGFLEKPIALQKLLATVGQALRQPAPAAQPAPCLWPTWAGAASSPSCKQRLETVEGAEDCRCCITGEPGCGKSLCARFLHQANTPWVAPESFDILDDPANNIVGQAAEGTLFLHEVGDLTGPCSSATCWRSWPRPSATTRGWSARPRARCRGWWPKAAFDSRLYAAISQIQLRVPSLREHPEDIPEIARLILARAGGVQGGAAAHAQHRGAQRAAGPGVAGQPDPAGERRAHHGAGRPGARDRHRGRQQCLAELDAPVVGRALRRCRSTWSCARRATRSSACTSSITSRAKART